MIRNDTPDERITIADNGWLCVCGNAPWLAGFYPCNEQGELVEPTPEEWTTDWYVCDECDRVIDQESLSVVGVRTQDTQPLRQQGNGKTTTGESGDAGAE